MQETWKVSCCLQNNTVTHEQQTKEINELHVKEFKIMTVKKLKETRENTDSSVKLEAT